MTRPPHVAALVHFVEADRPGGPPRCRAGIVTDVLSADPAHVDLHTFTGYGVTGVTWVAPGDPLPGGEPCGWGGDEGVGYPADTWHWPVVPGEGGP
jgi:hypothetical protein